MADGDHAGSWIEWFLGLCLILAVWRFRGGRGNPAPTALFLLFFLIPSLSQATTSQFSLISNRPVLGAGDFIISLGTDRLSRHQWGLGIRFDYGYRPLEFVAAGARTRGVVDHLFVQHFEAAYAPFSFLEIDLNLLVIWWNAFTQPVLLPPAASNQIGIGDPLLHGQGRPLCRHKEPRLSPARARPRLKKTQCGLP